jgi:CysZ protein
MEVLKWALVLPFVFIVCYFTFTSVGMIVASPFHDFLSERIEQHLNPTPPQPSAPLWHQIRQMLRNMLSSLRIVVRQIFAMVLTLPFLLVPYIGFLPLFVVTAYFTGLGFLDVPMARHNIRHADKKPIIRSCRWYLLGMGLAMECMFLVPFLALLLLPMGVVAGTILWHQVSARRT